MAVVQAEAAAGRAVFLLAEDAALASKLASRLGIFAGIIVPDHGIGETRLQAVLRVTKGRPFGFIGHDAADMPIWHAAHQAWVVGGGRHLRQKVNGVPLAGGPNRFHALWRGMRPHHWAKNMLVFLPIIAAHQWGNAQAIADAALAFVVFCLASSAIYLINDLYDLADDRHHPHKRHRAVAAGHLGVGQATGAALVFLVLAFGLSYITTPPGHLPLWVAVYAATAVGYSVWLKTLRFVDLISLSVLYTLRVVAGGAAAGIAVSSWLLALCLMLFLSLASAKRCAELALARTIGPQAISRRGYSVTDYRLIFWFGVGSAVAAAGVFLSYAATQAATLYPHPGILAMVAGWLMLWVLRIWRKVMSGSLGTDPIQFALRDPVSWTLAAALAVTFVFAAM